MKQTLREFKEAKDQPEEEHEWDKKKIAVAGLVLIFLLGVAYYFNLLSAGKDTLTSVLGIEFKKPEIKRTEPKKIGDVEPPSFQEVKSAVQSKIEDIQKDVQNLDLNEVASSSPQVQKIINDIKALEKYPSTQAKQICENICKSL